MTLVQFYTVKREDVQALNRPMHWMCILVHTSCHFGHQVPNEQVATTLDTFHVTRPSKRWWHFHIPDN